MNRALLQAVADCQQIVDKALLDGGEEIVSELLDKLDIVRLKLNTVEHCNHSKQSAKKSIDYIPQPQQKHTKQRPT